MNIQKVRFLREVLVTDAKGHDTITMEFSYDSDLERTPHFFEVPAQDVPKARSLYAAWGGRRTVGHRQGTTVNGPWIPFIQSKSMWRQNGNH